MSEREAYQRQGYVALPKLFPVEVLTAFYQQLRGDFERGGRRLNSFMARGPLLTRDAIEIYAYQYPPMLTFLWGLTPRMSVLTGKDLLPTYGYLRLYQQGDICRVHTDRPACEHSLSLTIAYGDGRTWPLSVGTGRVDQPRAHVADDFEADAFASVPMEAGDGVAYQGVHHRHGRVVPNPNSWSAHLFLHWVDRNGTYAGEAFDRPTLERAGVRMSA